MGNADSSDNWAFRNLLVPHYWEELGDNLIIAANKLEPETEGPIYNRIYLMLIGFALENYYKGAMILLKDNYAKAINTGKINHLKNHNLLGLASKAGLNIHDDLHAILNQLTEYIVWRSRYPAPLEATGDKGIKGKIRFSPPSSNNSSFLAPYSLELSTIVTKPQISKLIDQAKSNLDNLKQTIKIT
jgi:hypothetical protein